MLLVVLQLQVQAAVMTFMQNMQMAVRPQIIKSYATFDLSYMHTLVVASSKYGFFNVGANFPDYVVCVDPILKNLAWGSSWIYGGICANHVNDRFVGVLKSSIN